jgi:outer membrane lipopolysaccharide assembly protein LptE/RlpB
MKRSKNWLALLTTTILLSSCGAQWHLKKAIKKDPTILEKDTVVVVDTLVTAPVEVKDTITLEKRDTLVLTRDRLKLKIVRSFDTIAVEAECASDTIISTIRVPYEKVVYIKQRTLKEKAQTWAFYLLSCFVVYGLIKKFYR